MDWRELLIITTIISVVVSKPHTVLIITPNIITAPCPINNNCTTLLEYASQTNEYFVSFITLQLLPGHHNLDRLLTFSNLTLIEIQPFSYPNSIVMITCANGVHLEFQNLTKVDINNIDFLNCAGNKISMVKEFNLHRSQVIIQNNLSQTEKIFGDNNDQTNPILTTKSHAHFYHFSSERAFIIENSIASFNDCNITTGNNGALFIQDSDIAITSTNFDTAITSDCYGDIVVSQSKAVISTSKFTSNSTGNTCLKAYTAVFNSSFSEINILNCDFKHTDINVYDCPDLSVIYFGISNIVNIFSSTFTNITFHKISGFSFCIQIAEKALTLYYNNTVTITHSNILNITSKAVFHVYKNNYVQITSSNFSHSSDNVVFVSENNLISISSSHFSYNSGDYAVVVGENNSLSINSTNFSYNSVDYVVYVYENNLVSINSCYFCNDSGDVVNVNENGNFVSINNSYFSHNSGRVVYVEQNNLVSITSSNFHHNSDVAIRVMENTNSVSISNSHFSNNNQLFNGQKSTIKVNNSSFQYNSAITDSIFTFDSSVVEWHGNITIQNNTAGLGLINVVQSSLYFYGNTEIRDNLGSVFVFNSNVTFSGETKFNSNFGNAMYRSNSNGIQQGGAIAVFRSNLIFSGPTLITENEAVNGGGILAIDSVVYIFKQTRIANNKASMSGGGIYAYQSQVNFEGHNSISSNTASENGGGIHSIGGSVSVSAGSLDINHNHANLGGGIHLELYAKVIILKREAENLNYPNLSLIALTFTNNTADEKGGAIFVADNTTSGTCSGDDSSQTSNECFLQEISLYNMHNEYRIYESPNEYNLINFHFIKNKANIGEVLYGGLLDRCNVSPFVENYGASRLGFQFNNFTTGIEYFRAVTNMTDNQENNSISSDPVYLCFCTADNQPNCTYRYPTIQVQKGESFYVSLIAVDQLGHTIRSKSLIVAKASNSSGLGEGQASQYTRATGSCTQLKYNMISLQPLEQLILYAEGPCKDIGRSQRTIDIFFLDCTCPIGFVPSTSKVNCSCECDPELTNRNFVKECFYKNSTLLRNGIPWISISSLTMSSTNGTSYAVAQYCPYDYCYLANHPVYINLSISNGSDAQCAFNRTGKLCGTCKEGLSLTLGSSRCMSCSNDWLALLIPFVLAGIALVVFILMCNLTVAAGTINGLIFYANIVTANRSIFLPFNNPNVLAIFMAWLNLDFGFQTCFYNGMDSTAKVWLQLVFPAYIILLIIGIIGICKYSDKFSALIGSRNPVATLDTLLLLSYTKLLRIIITALQYTNLNHLDSGDQRSERIWHYDANVTYLKGKHIPLFVTAVLVIILSLIYTLLLLFWQWLQYCSNKRCLKWVNNIKLKALMDAYHAPYRPNHRYWTGLLLLARVVLYLITSFNVSGDPNVDLLTVGCILVGILGLKSMFRIYDNQIIDNLENSFLLNICLLTIATQYTYSKSNQDVYVLATISMSISFATFFGILVYHCYTSFFIKITFFRTCIEKLNNLRREHKGPYKDEESEPLLSDMSDDSFNDEENMEYRLPLRDMPEPTTDEYRQLEAAQCAEARRKRAKPKQETTYSVVEIPHPDSPNCIYHCQLVEADVHHSDGGESVEISNSPRVDTQPQKNAMEMNNFIV